MRLSTAKQVAIGRRVAVVGGRIVEPIPGLWRSLFLLGLAIESRGRAWYTYTVE